jgi:hypothetical protein
MSFARLSPDVQRIQASSPYIDIYTKAPANLLRSQLPGEHAALVASHAHPELKRWTKSDGWGARHVNDQAPFNLWDEQSRKYRMPKGDKVQWLTNKFGDVRFGTSGWYLWIETANPPQPVPLTLGCMPVIFIGVGEEHHEPLPQSPYPNPRIPDPCPALHWPTMAFPTKEQNITLLTALEPIANIRGVIYMPHWTVVELEYGDGRVYEAKSLPGIVGGRTTLYHHAEAPYFKSLKNATRARRIDPAQYTTTNLGSTPQDNYDYLRQSWCLSPGCRLECGYGVPDSPTEGLNAATSAGIKLRKVNGQEVLTVSNHGFLISKEVYHPHVDEEKIGDVLDRRPELDVALVQLTPDTSAKFTNACYFQAETPRMLLESSQINQGSWSEVDGMSSGLVSLLTYGRCYMKPERPLGHPKIAFTEWRAYSVNAMFGAINNTICEGMRGAPLVQCETGGVGGFFDFANGSNCINAHVDDLVAEGWQLA